MIHTAGLILKITGILLVLLFLFLFLCIVMLFSISVRYHGSIQRKEETSARLVMNGPLFLYRLWIEWKDGSLRYQFRVLGILILENQQKESGEKKVREKKGKKKPKGFFAKIKYTFHEFYVKIKKTWNTSKELRTLLKKEVTKEAFQDLKKELGFFFRLFRPDKLEGYVEFGTGDPAGTGQLLGLISIFCFGYLPDVAFYPVFDEKTFSTELFVRGRLSLRKALGCLVRLYGNRKIKYVFNKISNLGGNKHVK